MTNTIFKTVPEGLFIYHADNSANTGDVWTRVPLGATVIERGFEISKTIWYLHYYRKMPILSLYVIAKEINEHYLTQPINWQRTFEFVELEAFWRVQFDLFDNDTDKGIIGIDYWDRDYEVTSIVEENNLLDIFTENISNRLKSCNIA